MSHLPNAADASGAPDISLSRSSPTFSIPSPRQFDRFQASRPPFLRNESASEWSAENHEFHHKGVNDDFLERYNPQLASNLATAAKQAEAGGHSGYASTSGSLNGSKAYINGENDDLTIVDAGPPVSQPGARSRRHFQISPQYSNNDLAEKHRWSEDHGKYLETASNEREQGSTDSGYETGQTSVDSSSFMPLQDPGFRIEPDELDPIIEDNQRSFDLTAPPKVENDPGNQFSLETRAEQLLSRDHLQAIFDEPTLLSKFTSFITIKRPQSTAHLIYYLETRKALRAIKYANGLVDAVRPNSPFILHPPQNTVNKSLEASMEEAFQVMVREDLPAYVTHIFIQVASSSIQKRITGTLAPHLQEVSEGLAEVFCLTDPSRPDNPIIFASEEFHWTTQYGVNYAIGRNCRFLQGPKSNLHTIRRLREAVTEGKEHSEAILNYRRDGSPFMNLLMTAPLVDNQGHVRYHIGAQVDVSGLVRDCTDLPGLQNMLLKLEGQDDVTDKHKDADDFLDLAEMFNSGELSTVRRHGGRMYKEQSDSSGEGSSWHRPRLLLKETSPETGSQNAAASLNIYGNLEGIYQHYLLVRAYPALRILFTSPSLRVPGIQQSSFLTRIGGSQRVRDELELALSEGRGVTAKVRWLTRADSDSGGQPRWIHCTPLLGPNGKVGIWMIILIDEANTPARSFKKAPPVPSNAAIREGGGASGGEGLPATGQSTIKTSTTINANVAVNAPPAIAGPGTAITTDVTRVDSIRQPSAGRNRTKTLSSISDRVRIPSPGMNGSSYDLGSDLNLPSHDSPQQMPPSHHQHHHYHHQPQRQNGIRNQNAPEPRHLGGHYEQMLYKQPDLEQSQHPRQQRMQRSIEGSREKFEDMAHQVPVARSDPPGQSIQPTPAFAPTAPTATATPFLPQPAVPLQKQSRFAHYLNFVSPSSANTKIPGARG